MSFFQKLGTSLLQNTNSRIAARIARLPVKSWETRLLAGHGKQCYGTCLVRKAALHWCLITRGMEAVMIQESTTWDWRQLHPMLSTSMRIHALFLLVAFVVTLGKLISVWRSAPPFNLSRQSGNAAYKRSLCRQSVSLKNWIGCILLTWGLSTSTSLYGFVVRLLDEKTPGSFQVLIGLLGFSTALTQTLLVLFFIFLVRWHMIRRAEALSVPE